MDQAPAHPASPHRAFRLLRSVRSLRSHPHKTEGASPRLIPPAAITPHWFLRCGVLLPENQFRPPADCSAITSSSMGVMKIRFAQDTSRCSNATASTETIRAELPLRTSHSMTCSHPFIRHGTTGPRKARRTSARVGVCTAKTLRKSRKLFKPRAAPAVALRGHLENRQHVLLIGATARSPERRLYFEMKAGSMVTAKPNHP